MCSLLCAAFRGEGRVMLRWSPWALGLGILTMVSVARPPSAQARAQARAQVNVQAVSSKLAAMQGRIVTIERSDGAWLPVRILRVGPRRVTVELEDGTRGTIRLRSIARVRPAWRNRPDGPFPHNVAPGKTSTVRSTKLRVEWIGARFAVGLWSELYPGIPPYCAVFGELLLFTLRWRHFYWETVRVGGGVPMLWHWGTAVGYPFELDDEGRHELRLGVHLTMYFGFFPSMSGLQLYYLYRPSGRLSLRIGLMQTSLPFTVTLTLGVSM